jgi:hypothetical protein
MLGVRIIRLLSAAWLLAVALPLATATAGEQSAVAYVQSLYAAEEPQSKARYFPRLDKLWAECYRTEKELGYVCLDFDMFVMGQDAQLSNLRIEQPSGDANKAVVQARFKNFGKEHTVTFDLSHDATGWMIDEMRSGCYILSELLQDQSNC